MIVPQDVKKTAANDDGYFVFEDTMHQVSLLPPPLSLFLLPSLSPSFTFSHFSTSCGVSQVLLAFLHDTSLLQHFEHLSVSPLKAYVRGQQYSLQSVCLCLASPLRPLLPGNVGVPEYEVVYPPSGESNMTATRVHKNGRLE